MNKTWLFICSDFSEITCILFFSEITCTLFSEMTPKKSRNNEAPPLASELFIFPRVLTTGKDLLRMNSQR